MEIKLFASGDGTQRASIFVVFWMLCTINVAAVTHILPYRMTPFWDLNIYIRGITDYSSGVNPYCLDFDYPFIYHPYVLKFFSCVNDSFSLHWALIIFYALSTPYFFYEISL